MDLVTIAVLLGVVAFFAHIIKGLTGFGPAIVFVSIGSLIHEPTTVIVLASLLDIIGGGYLSLLNPQFFGHKAFWVPVGGLMVIGAVLGSVALSVVPATVFEYLLGGAIVLISVWFLRGTAEPDGTVDEPDGIGRIDGLVGVFSGFCGGFTGMGGPPLIAYLGARFEKGLFRAIIVPIFLMAAIARFASYGALGMIDAGSIWLYLVPPIGVIVGNHVGDHFFEDVEQQKFTVLIGLILMASGIRLIIA